MWFAVISIFPDYFKPLTSVGITSKAFINNTATLMVINPRDFAEGNYKKVDDRPYGGGAGMVMMPEPLAKAIRYAKKQAIAANKINVPVVYMSPQGKQLTDTVVDNTLSYDGLIIICGRYDGIDERIINQFVDFECSIGDYVLSGGEIAAMTYMDSVIRKIPNVLGHEESAIEDSFVNGLLDYPVYTKPNEFEGIPVPDVLKSGDHKKIKEWRFCQQYRKTQKIRPDLLENIEFSEKQLRLIHQIDEKEL